MSSSVPLQADFFGTETIFILLIIMKWQPVAELEFKYE